MTHATAASKTATHSLSSWPRLGGWLAAVAALIALLLGSLMVGRYALSPHDALAALVGAAPSADAAAVMIKVRLPRILVALTVGMALSASGAAFQGVFRNPLVSPDILGVAQGAGFGAALALLFGWSGIALQAMSFACGLAAVTLAYGLSRRQGLGGATLLVMVLSGMIVGTLFSAGVALIKVVSDPVNTLPAITFWLMGSLGSVSSRDLAWIAVPVLVGVTALMLLRWRLNALCFGDDEARTLGVNVSRLRLIVIVAATLMTAACVSISGVIGLVGLIVPHLARLIVGPNYRALLPASALLGAGFLLAVDDFARVLSASEVPLGILTSLLGAPFFLMLLSNVRKGWS
ncbi:iron complex transport system permease protein [Rhodoblastus acidophilus]|uniref:FecCD family ABC transporter permease n=1 Tax=Rhodoblastus acidophilus TaxID=1074 RepID=UPI00222552D0|nr:iron ABC transporter permease [Rhodoblastus acidophilus]MCW2319136.1 iron complex transport system permease protein [Rhodoblastus acidophilus]